MSHNPGKTINLTIDGIALTVPEGTGILQAAEKAGVRIPTLCDHSGLGKRAVCRICVVECDGRSKLVPACANEVWEGVNIVTSNPRILDIRKTIVELLLANHPQDCLVCVRNGTCELQKLAADFGIRAVHFHHYLKERHPSETANGILVRDMDKCVKCGRCVEVCQEIQTVRAINSGRRSADYGICTPYNEALSEGPCIYCGQCAEVCPVGALYGYDQSALVWEALNKNEKQPVTQIESSIAPSMDSELDLPPGTVTSGKMVTALKQLGFDKVFDAGFMAKMNMAEMAKELLDRINNEKNSARKLPLIAGCSPALNNFVKEFYPDLLDHLPLCKSPEQTFGALLKTGPDASKVAYVSIAPCIAKKLEAPNLSFAGSRNVDAALTVRELAGMIRIAGIDFTHLPETPFDSFPDSLPEGEAPAGRSDDAPGARELRDCLSGIYRAYIGGVSSPCVLTEAQGRDGIKEIELNLDGRNIKVLEVNGFANARKVMDSIRKDECPAALVLIKSCSRNQNFPLCEA